MGTSQWDLTACGAEGRATCARTCDVCSFVIQVSQKLVSLLPQCTLYTAARGIPLKLESNHVTPLLYSFLWVLMSLKVKAKSSQQPAKSSFDLIHTLLLPFQLLLLLSTSLTPLGLHRSSCWSYLEHIKHMTCTPLVICICCLFCLQLSSPRFPYGTPPSSSTSLCSEITF